MQDWLGKMMPDPEKWAGQFAAHPVVARPVVMPADDPFGVAWTRRAEPHPVDAAAVSALNAHKLSACMEASDELLMDCGVIPDTRPKPPPPTWRTRFRRKREQWRERAARRAYKVIAGYWPADGEDDW